MSWNYRLVDYGSHLAVHEVYYRDGHIVGVTIAPFRITGETIEDIEADLKLILSELRRFAPLRDADLDLNGKDAAVRRALESGARGIDIAGGYRRVMARFSRIMARLAQGIDTRSAIDAKRRGPKGESPVPQGCAQQPGGSPSVRDTE